MSISKLSQNYFNEVDDFLNNDLISFPTTLTFEINFLTSKNEVISILKCLNKKIKINFADSLDFPARWNPHTGEIRLSSSFFGNIQDENERKAKLIGYILFELHNAANPTLNELLYHSSSCKDVDDITETIERLEHESTIKTHAMIKKWVGEGLISSKAPFQDVFEDFSIHYRYQQLLGHSQKIAKRWEAVAENKTVYQGSWPLPIKEDEKKHLHFAFHCYAAKKSNHPQLERLNNVFFASLNQLDGTNADLSTRLKNHLKLLSLI